MNIYLSVNGIVSKAELAPLMKIAHTGPIDVVCVE